MIALLIIGILSSVKCEEALERFPNARYLGMGYNMVTGNPENNLNDPGFTFSVLGFTWSAGTTTSDGKYLVPDHVQALQIKSCGFQSDALLEFGSLSYQQALSVDVSVEAGWEGYIWDARFTASAGYKKISDGTVRYRRVYTSARAKCIQYQLSVNYLNAAVTVTSNFAGAVTSLPLERDNKAYYAFINTYGTYFTSHVTMGAKLVIRSEFDELALTRMEETALKVQKGTKLSFLSFVGGLNTETQVERQQREAFERIRRSYSSSYLGSHPPSDGKWETWAQSTANSPYPVRYKVVPLTELFTNKFFPNTSRNDLEKKRDLLTAAFNFYCSDVSGCEVPPPDRTPTRTKKAVSKFVGSARVSCPPTYQLLSCGILNLGMSGSYDRRRYAVPAGQNSCDCHDDAGARCVLWCSSTALQYRTVTSTQVRGLATASCPAGYKVKPIC